MFNFLNSEACICTVSDLETIRGYAADAKGHLKTALIGKCPCTSQGLQAHAARALHTMCILPAVERYHWEFTSCNAKSYSGIAGVYYNC